LRCASAEAGVAMFIRFQPTIEWVNHFVGWFIPAEMNGDREKQKQAKMFLFSHIFGPFIGNVIPAAIYVLDPHPTYDVAILALSITAFWVFPFVLRWWGHYEALVILSVQNLIFCILWSCYFYGGVTSPTLSWVLTIPLLAFFYIGPHSRLRMVLLGLFLFNFVAFTAVYVVDPTGGKHLPLASLQGLGLVSTTCTGIYVMMMAIYYAKILASGAELEAEARQHLATSVALRQAALEAERAGAAKTEFLAKTSHELRTPLSAILGYSKLMLEEAVEEGDTHSVPDLENIYGAGQDLLKLINEILDLAKLEAGRMELFIETCDPGAIVGDVAQDYIEAARRKRTEIVFDLSRAPKECLCDIQKVEETVGQLLDNAVKFTENGKITVSVEQKITGSRADLVIAVRDTGIGIARDVIPSLFEHFTVSQDSSSSKYGGTGLGLALCQRYCRLMGGHILVESTVGEGTCFTVQLPWKPGENTAEPLPGATQALQFAAA
jgi:signal transduction histidine kinase